jgi:hypothetical protein
VTIARRAERSRLLLDARDAPDRHVPPAVRLLGVDDGDVGLRAGTAISSSPVNGQVTGAIVSVTLGRSVPT